MNADAKAATPLRTRIGRGVLVALVAILALSAFGACFPGLPYLAGGQLILEWFGSWVAILSILAATLTIRRWRGDRRTRHLVLAAIATLTAIGTLIVVVSQLSAALASGSRINLARSLYVGPMPHSSATPQIQTYAHEGGVGLPLAIYRPAPDPSGRPAPVLIYVHGGGWISGRYGVRDADLRWFADHGVVAVSVEYTLSNANRHMWAQTQGQIGCAMAWVGANIGRYGGDPTRVAMTGESAGGNLVLNASYMANQGTLRPTCGGSLPHVSTVIALYPVIDVAEFYRIETRSLSTTSRDMTTAYTGGTPRQFPDRYAYVSPAAHISPSAPATVLIVGANDTLVPPGPAYPFARAVRDAGVDVELISLPFAGHAFDILSGSITNQLVRNATLRAMSAQGMTP